MSRRRPYHRARLDRDRIADRSRVARGWRPIVARCGTARVRRRLRQRGVRRVRLAARVMCLARAGSLVPGFRAWMLGRRKAAPAVAMRGATAHTAGRIAACGGIVEAVKAVVLHQLDELRAVLRVGGVDAGQRRRKRVRVRTPRHRGRIVAAVRQEPAVGVDALGDVLIDLEGSREVHELAVDHLLCGLHVAACWPGSLDPEQVVVVGRQGALTPAGFVDGLGDRDGGRYPVLALGGHGTPRDLLDEGLLDGSSGPGCIAWRHVVPVIRRECGGVAGMVLVRPLEQPGDRCLARPRPLRPGWPELRGRDVGGAAVPARVV